ncbi:hypothetical protein [Phaeocystidibacter luteus]|uniref:Uncharacterized protein n=1 Tax=Phaeocystidibacter luteus TaxID=911197 RepID=A0A6N6RKX0_9FLAO|nr:hypothetical protein [Phaeocystidibacter luteus]KAB2814019.1 hypothetical protein F8C67_04890 [Phaeocystidibacter luteus]
MKAEQKFMAVLVWLITAYAFLWFGQLFVDSTAGWVAALIILSLGGILEFSKRETSKTQVLLTWVLFLFVFILSMFTLSVIFSLAYGMLLVSLGWNRKEQLYSLWSRD